MPFISTFSYNKRTETELRVTLLFSRDVYRIVPKRTHPQGSCRSHVVCSAEAEAKAEVGGTVSVFV
jgi:hypothetical protein